MEKAAFILRPMKGDDIMDAFNLSDAQGWNQTKKDWELFIENPQNICMLAGHGKKIIGTTTAINYSNLLAWISMVLVDKEYRGQGISKLLLTNVLEKLASFKSIKLDATAEGERVYTKFDFKEEYPIYRMTNLLMKSLPASDNDDKLTEAIQVKYINEVIAFDELIFGANRRMLIEFLIREYPAKGWLLKRNGMMAGFVLGRDGNKYHHVGPVSALNTTDAQLLIKKGLEELTNQPVVVDVAADKEDLINWLSKIGFTRQRRFVRMYKKENPFPGITENQYLICGPEFG